jgi:hypothetical protein
MVLRKSFLILLGSAMLVIAMCAIDVGSAAASTTEECKIPKAGEEFTAPHFLDANCEKGDPSGEYHTVPYIEKAGVILKRTNTGIIWMESTIAGVAAQIKCETYGGEKTAFNYTEGETRGFKGEGTMTFSGCTMTKPVASGCTVAPIETVPLAERSEDLLELMRVTYEPKEGSKFMTISLSGCALKGSYPVEGKARSQTLNIHTEEFGKTSGSELLIAKSPFVLELPFHDATKSDGKTVVRETP